MTGPRLPAASGAGLRARLVAVAAAAALVVVGAGAARSARADEPPAATAPVAATPPAVGSSENPDRQHETGNPPPPEATGSGFSFGSYGRVGVGSDGRGHEGYPVNVVSHGSRLEEPPYVELDLYYGGVVGDRGARWRVVIAPAFGGDLFHYTGDFTSRFALRNAYAEVEGLGYRGLHLWAGSRMLRGDDVYLFDYWPLDNLNTVGAGGDLVLGRLELQLHGGLNRLDDPYHYQAIDTPPRGLGPPGQAVVLDRPRTVLSFKATYHLGRAGSQSGAKLSLYGELHVLPEGQRTFVTQERTETLPSETGFVVGGQAGGWLRPYVFANLFARYAGGIAAYGELNAPGAVDAARQSSSAREFVLALSLNYETRLFGVMGGAFLRTFTDAGPGAYDPRTYVEGMIAARPTVYLTSWLHLAAELSYQARQYGGFDPSVSRRLAPSVWRASLLPIVSPLGRGTYQRPILYLVGTVSSLDADARLALFDPKDLRSGTSPVLYLGVGAEWWFQSSYR